MRRRARPREVLDPDLTRRDEAPYWAAALVLAIRSGDADRAGRAQRELRRLGLPLTTAAAPACGRGARR
jgi:hypothetical protein